MHILNPQPVVTDAVNTLRTIIEQSLDDDKAENIVTIDLAGKSDFADYMIIATGRSARHVATLADKLADRLKQAGTPALSLEGKENCEWVIADCADIIVHLFKPEIREIYQLEKMWSAPTPELAEAAG